MDKTDQYQRYRDKLPKFFEQIEVLELKHGISLIEKMKAHRYHFDNFCGIMAEMDFGIYLDQFCDKLEFEPIISGLTPDWRVDIDGVKVIIEVARLKDTQEVEAQSAADQQAGKIVIRRLKMRPQRVFGNTIMTKLKTYGDLIRSNQLPFIIGIYNRHLSGAHSEDAGILFHQSAVEERMVQDATASPEVKQAFLEKLSLARELVSGILWLDQPGLNPVTWVTEEKEFIFWRNDRALFPVPKAKILLDVAGVL